MSNLKNSWKNTGTELGHAFRDLGKTLINSGKKGVDKAVDWAESGQPQQPVQQPAQQRPPVQQPIQQRPPVQQRQYVQPAPNALVADEILKLAELKQQGFLTEEEFNSKKKQLLGL